MERIRNEPELTGFDAAAAFEAVSEVAGDDLRAFVEYDAEAFNPLFVAERVVDDLGNPENVDAFAEKLHFNYKLDFTEREMYADLYGPLGGVDAFAVYLDDQTIVRYVTDEAGIYVSLDGDTDTDRVVDLIAETVEDEE
ncbi:hypothetical protein [Halorussus halobius]|uniref:hypothetical protein n=1 Tax=Halorussus halobius TaxID=1710537 RepID=UPI0010920991|nr:hypothetical protein [Halorussus halobius]